MAHLYRTWFLWGFWDKIFQLTIIVVFLPFLLSNKKRQAGERSLLTIVFWVLQTISCLSSLSWLVLGFIWRFSRGGRVTSGDKLERLAGTSDDQWALSVEKASAADGYQIRSGKVMAILLYIVVIAIFAFVFFGSLILIISWCSGSSNDTDKKAANAAQANPSPYINLDGGKDDTKDVEAWQN